MRSRVARVAALVTVFLGVATGLFFVYGPTGTRCTITGVARPGEPVVTSPQRCETTRMIDVQGQWWPMPGVALIVWSLAPVLAVAGVWSARLWLVTLALAMEATVLISFGAGPLYIPFVLLPLAITWFIARRAARAA
jgi:hypothetical protein